MASRPWTSSEEEWLTENYASRTLPELARELGRSEHAVQIKASQMRKTGVVIGRCVTSYTVVDKEEFPVEIPDVECKSYFLEVRNDWKVVSSFFVKTKERVKQICTRYGRGYRFMVHPVIE